MSYSLNETEALCRKATRGAGFSWGQAEAAGRAARWLHLQGLGGAESLAKALETPGAFPLVEGVNWLSAGGPLCPILTGTALADHAHVIGTSGVRLGAVNAPLLLLGFVSVASYLTVQNLKVETPLGRAVVFRDDLDLSGRFDSADQVILAVGHAPKHLLARQTRAEMTPDVYGRLDRFALGTYAPATEASRIAGAGAGLSDND